MNKVPTAYLIVGGLAVTGGTLMYMYNNDKDIRFNNKPGMKYLTWLKWKLKGSPKIDMARDFDNITDNDRAIINRSFSVPNSSATIPRY